MLSWLGIGKKKEEAPKKTNESLGKLQTTSELLDKRERLLQKKIEQEKEKATKFIQQKNKNAAALCLKRKKQYELQIERINAQRMNLDTMMLKVEEAVTDVEVLQAQKTGAKALKNAYGGLKAEDIDKQIDDVRETMEGAEEVSQALSQSLTLGEDEGDIEDELAALQDEIADEEALKMPKTPSGKLEKPGVSEKPKAAAAVKAPAKKKPVVVEEDEDAELAALEAELA